MKHILEAKRHINNAQDILSTKAQKEDGYYQDKKYIKMAGHTAYTGVLVALDEALKRPKKGRKSVDWYKEEIGKLDRKILNYFNDVYEHLHLVMGYDGYGNEKVIKIGFEAADKVISWAEQKTL
ncbi:MAG: hypothetical protein EAZ53_04015 [Bacteroidetes bacterium]|nr:MAG: hypothetical protein EAZ53_04015 [Bacteroidota bacterium]